MEKKYEFVVVGFGHAGKRLATIIANHPQCELIAIIDNDPHRLLEAELAFPNSKSKFLFSSLDSYFNNAEVKAEIAGICTPNGLHASMAILCMQNGLEVVIEKPMCINVIEGKELLHISKKTGRQVFVVKQNRYSPPSKWMKEIVGSKTIGEVLMVQVNCYWNRDDRYYKPGAWKGTLKLDGGTLFTQFSHFIDIMYWVFGDIKNIKATFADFNHHHNTEFEDSGVVNFEFVNGGLGCINFSTSVWDSNMESSITVVGSKGSFKVGGQYMNEVEYCHIENYQMPELPTTNAPNDYGPYKGSAANHHYVIENVVNTLGGKDTITTNALEGLKVVDIIERIYEHRNLKGLK